MNMSASTHPFPLTRAANRRRQRFRLAYRIARTGGGTPLYGLSVALYAGRSAPEAAHTGPFTDDRAAACAIRKILARNTVTPMCLCMHVDQLLDEREG